MPRYFFNVLDGRSKNLVRDSEGAVFSRFDEARKEAIGLAKDFAKHGRYGSTSTWKLVVADENGREVLTLLLSEFRPSRIRAWFDLVRHVAVLDTRVRPRILAWLLAVATLGILVQAATRTVPVPENVAGYQTASVPAEGTVVAVRFVPNANVADITKFLEAYMASFVGGPQPSGFYRLRIAETSLSKEELVKIVNRMAREPVVEFAAAAQ